MKRLETVALTTLNGFPSLVFFSEKVSEVKCEMKTKTSVLVSTLVLIAVATPATFVLAQHGYNYYTDSKNTASNLDTPLSDDEWQEMRQYMEQHWADHEDDGWWQEAREHIEQRFGETQSDGWWHEMRQYMEEHWAELDEEGAYCFGKNDGYVYGGYNNDFNGFGGSGGCRR
jgi:hypothetical protein